MRYSLIYPLAALFVLFANLADAQQRAVQIREIDFSAGTIELFNFGSTTEDMASWRFCTHDDDQIRVYSAFPGVGGMIAPGQSVLFDVANLLVASPFDNDAYSMAIFDTSAGGFNGTANMIDHLQWSLGGANDNNANLRSGQAVTAGLWTDAAQWIATDADTVRIQLTDMTGGILHGPADYVALPGIAACDFDGDGTCDLDDLNDMLAIGPINAGVPAAGNEQFDLNDDNVINLVDRDEWLAQAAAENGFSSPYKVGDADLNGTVDGQDFISWNASKFLATLRWDEGDFNGDGTNDGQDFVLWNANKFTASDGAVVPEPSQAMLMAMVALIVAGRRFV